MSKWRPTADCIYVIGDIHGADYLLKNICDRILPLRTTDGIKDRLIFLGDYIDRSKNAHKVIDKLIDIKKKYPDQAVFIMGNHELMLLRALNCRLGINYSLESMNNAYKMWMNNGGRETIAGYLERIGKKQESYENLPRFKVDGLIPKEHIQFFQSLEKGYEFENFAFVHGGLNPLEPISKQEMDELCWDNSLCKFVQNAISVARVNKTKPELPWDKIVICGHSAQTSMTPIIADNYMMLDCGSPKQLLVAEIRTRTAYMAETRRKVRMVKFSLENTK